LLHIRCRD